MFDTHCHLNFKRFKNSVSEVIQRAKEAGVQSIVIPGTDVVTSQKAVEIASQYEGVYVAVGIHPHHALQFQMSSFKSEIEKLKTLLMHSKVVAIGEVGLDKHEYTQTKYKTYKVDDQFIEAQKQLLIEQIKLALKYDKSLILHNREAKDELLPLLEKCWDKKLEGRTVFHCCEPDMELLEFAQNHGIFIGVDGDVTYLPEKAEFVKKVPLEMLVLETDSPYLLPEPLRMQKLYPNEPKNITVIAEYIAYLKGLKKDQLQQVTYENSKKLFAL